MSAADFTTALEELVQTAATRALAQVLMRREQDPGRSPWYTGDEAAEYCRMSREAVNQARKRGQLGCHRSETGRIRYHVEDLETFLRAKDAA